MANLRKRLESAALEAESGFEKAFLLAAARDLKLRCLRVCAAAVVICFACSLALWPKDGIPEKLHGTWGRPLAEQIVSESWWPADQELQVRAIRAVGRHGQGEGAKAWMASRLSSGHEMTEKLAAVWYQVLDPEWVLRPDLRARILDLLPETR